MSFKTMKVFPSSEGVVWKHVFDFGDAIAETVLYRYAARTVICCSVMCGCPVGCVFCGTGKRFKRNLTTAEICLQITHTLDYHGIRADDESRFQIMFMSMGEPMLNWPNVDMAIKLLNITFPTAELLISTVGINDPDAIRGIIETSRKINKVRLQLSIHDAFDDDRNALIPFKNKLSLRRIRDFGSQWNIYTGRPVYLNYCIDKPMDAARKARMIDLFSPLVFNLTFSVICSADETMKDAAHRELDAVHATAAAFAEAGYSVRVFDPAGQDDIGGGCGQLWYTQEWFERMKGSAAA